jgi:hypothetical protein
VRHSFIPFLALLAACNSSGAPRSATYNYDLVTIDGQSLPAASGNNVVVRGGLTLDTCGRFVLSEVDTVSSTTSSTFQAVDGTWTMKGDSVHLTTRGSQAIYNGTVISSEVTLVPAASPNLVLVYHLH